MKLRYTPEAIADLQRIKRYIRETLHNPIAAQRISNMILAHCSGLKSFPQMGVELSALVECEQGLRMLVCERYVAIYHCGTDTVSVLRIFNGQQDFMRILFGDDIFN